MGAYKIYKGILDILEAFEIVANRFTDVNLVLAENIKSVDTEIKNALENHSFRNRIFVLGFVNNDEKRYLMSSATAVLFPLYYEGFDLPVLEGMACGSPVITTNVSSLPEVGGRAVEYVTSGDAEEMTHMINRLLKDSELRNVLSEEGKKKQ